MTTTRTLRFRKLLLAVLLLSALPLCAEPVEFRQAIELALKHSGAITAASADRARAAERYHAERYAYIPTVVFGSGLGYSVGQPVAVAGQAPSIYSLTHNQTLFNFAARESVKAAHSDSIAANMDYADRTEKVILDTALLYIELDNAVQRLALARQQKQAVEHAFYIARQRQQEGVGSALDSKRTELDSARVDLRIAELETTVDVLRERLGRSIGLSPETLATVSGSIPAAPPLRAEEDLASVALSNSASVRIADEHVRAARDRARAEHKMNYPSIDFAGQYAEFAKFNNYTEYFRAFQRNNGEIGVSVSVPLFANAQDEAQAAQAAVDSQRIRTELQRLRGRVETETRQAWEEIREAGTANEVARMDLDLVREQVSLLLAQMEEGKATLQEVEEARYAEHERWMQLYEARASLERAQFQLLRQTRMLVAALR